jgi:hypothetical protein
MDDLRTRARELRAAGKTPQQIARTLGVPRAKVNDLVRGTAVRRPTPTESPLVGCWISRQWSNGLRITDRPDDWVDNEDQAPFAVGAGLAQVLVARERGSDEVSVCGYLVDTYCLGVKNAVEPSIVAGRHLDAYVEDFFGAYPEPPLPAPIDLVRDLALGAVEYGRTLGFDPHPDFYLAAPHLGRWEPPGRITFGLDGKPFYQHGPYDDPTRVIRILDRTVGRGKYEILVVHGLS